MSTQTGQGTPRASGTRAARICEIAQARQTLWLQGSNATAIFSGTSLQQMAHSMGAARGTDNALRREGAIGANADGESEDGADCGAKLHEVAAASSAIFGENELRSLCKPLRKINPKPDKYYTGFSKIESSSTSKHSYIVRELPSTGFVHLP